MQSDFKKLILKNIFFHCRQNFLLVEHKICKNIKIIMKKKRKRNVGHKNKFLHMIAGGDDVQHFYPLKLQLI